MLGIIEMFVCPICDQPCLNENEFESEEENSVQCDLWSAWLHWGCSGFIKNTDLTKDFVCLLCQ